MAAKPKPLTLGQQIVALREARGWNDRQLATQLNRPLSQVQEYERGAKRPTELAFEALGAVLEFDFLAAFPLAEIAARELKHPHKQGARVTYLARLVTGGVQWKLAVVLGVASSRLSAVASDSVRFNAADLAIIGKRLPELHLAWLVEGKGEPFEGEVPTARARRLVERHEAAGGGKHTQRLDPAQEQEVAEAPTQQPLTADQRWRQETSDWVAELRGLGRHRRTLTLQRASQLADFMERLTKEIPT